MAKKLLTPEERIQRHQKRKESYDPVMAARNALRREFSRSPIVIEMMNMENSRLVPAFKKDGTRAKQDAREHLCAKCNEWKRSRKGSKFAIDHIDPVVDPVIGFVDINTYFERLWVSLDKTKLQKLCGDCHQIKTNAEWFVRRFKEELVLVTNLEISEDKAAIKKGVKRFTPKKFAEHPYPQDFVDRVLALKAKLLKL